VFKRKYTTLKDGKEVSLMEDARSMMSKQFSQSLSMNDSSSDLRQEQDTTLGSSSFRSTTSRPEFKRASESVASMGSNLAAHAKTLVGSFACGNERAAAGQVLSSERATEEWRGRRSVVNDNDQQSTPQQQRHQGLELSHSGSTNRSYRDNRNVDI
jgi:hypothetical protein